VFKNQQKQRLKQQTEKKTPKPKEKEETAKVGKKAVSPGS
jgi:hypothetical protein